MNIATLDTLLGTLRRVGNASGLPKNINQEQLIDELQRQLGALGSVCRALLQEERGSPRYSKTSDLFVVDCRPASSTIMSAAQANAEGFGVTDGLCIYKHGAGYNLDRYDIVYKSISSPTGLGVGAANQPIRSGSLNLFAFDSNRTVFQVDQDAFLIQACFVVSCYASIPPASTTTNPGQNTKAGASTPQLGIISAATNRNLP